MHVTLVHVHVVEGGVEAFLAATKANHLGSIKEPGNLRFDVLRDPNDPNRFLLYEGFVNEEAAKAHKHTPHYLEWREAVAGLMASPRRGETLACLYPEKW